MGHRIVDSVEAGYRAARRGTDSFIAASEARSACYIPDATEGTGALSAIRYQFFSSV